MKNNNIDYRVIPFVWAYGIVISLAIFFIGNVPSVYNNYTLLGESEGVLGYTWAISFALGLVTSLLNFSLMSKAVRSALEKPEHDRMRYLMMQQGLRYVIYLGIMVSVAFNDRFDLIFAFVGMLSVKIVMVIYILITKGGNE